MKKSSQVDFQEMLKTALIVPEAPPEAVEAIWGQVSQMASSIPKEKRLMNNPHIPLFLSRKAVSTLLGAVVVILVLFLAVTPTGQAIAAGIAQFFTFNESNTRPLPTVVQYTSTVGAATAVPLAPAGESARFFTFLAEKEADAPDMGELIGIVEAASQVDYPVQAPATIPDGYALDYARYIPYTDVLTLTYSYQAEGSTGEMFMLIESPELIPSEAGPDALVEQLTINGFEAEMVQGGWIGLEGQDHETWEPRMPVFTIKWFDGETYLTLQFLLNDDFHPAFLDRAAMIAVAESVQPVDLSGLSALTPSEQMQQMEAELGFAFLEPGVLPEGYALLRVEQVPGSYQVHAEYTLNGVEPENGYHVAINQIPLSVVEIRQTTFPDEVILVDIFGSQGRIMPAIGNAPGTNQVWWLFWETPDLAMSIMIEQGPDFTVEQAQTWLVQIAESMH